MDQRAARRNRKDLGIGKPVWMGAADLDKLTGVWNSAAVEAKIIRAMRDGGTLFVCDVDRLKRVNDQLGHYVGDECLKQVAKTLGYMTHGDGILGRIGGDEFVLFLSGCREQDKALELVRRIEERFRKERRGEKREKEALLGVTVGYAIKQDGEAYQGLVRRAQEVLLQKKKEMSEKESPLVKREDNYGKDVRQVREDLIEQIRKPGAYCQDYETFKGIYRFIERGIIRSKQKACVILITLVGEMEKAYCLMKRIL